MSKSHTQVFISYRRDGGAALARNVYDALEKRGYAVFMALESMRSGPFDQKLYEEIEAATDFVVILTSGCLTRCGDKDDWLRLEIAHAFKRKKNVVPFIDPNFSWKNKTELPPEGLSQDISRLSFQHGVPYSPELFTAGMDKLVGMLKAQPRRSIQTRFILVAAAVILFFTLSATLWLLRPVKITITIAEAQKMFAQKDYAGAFYAFSKASDADLQNISLHQQVEESARRGRLTNQFLQRYRALSKEHPDNPIFHNYLGNAYLLLDPDDKDGKARASYEKAIALDPQFAPAINNLGIIAYRQGDSAKAESMFIRYLKLNPQDAVGWADLGLLYLYRIEAKPDAGLVSLSQQAFDKALTLDSGLALAYKGKGRLFALQGQKDKALDAFKRSLALDYDQPEVRRQVELLVWESTREGTAPLADDLHTRDLREQLAMNRSLVEAMKALDSGNYKEAENLSRELLKQYPGNPLLLRILGRSLEAVGSKDEARQAFDGAVRGVGRKE